MSEKLAEFLKTGADWGKVKTSIPGVYVQKMPAYRSQPARLAVEVNPVDATGNPTKRKGLTIRDLDEYEEFKEILSNDRMESLFEMLAEVNPASTKRRGKATGDDIIEV